MPTETKKVAPTTKANFVAEAKPITLTINGRTFIASPKAFSTGSVGFNLNEKIEVTLSDGTVVKCQLGLNITGIGSKEWPAE